MFKDYQNDVLRAYHEMKADGSLSPNLVMPTPGKLKEECLKYFNIRFTPKDAFLFSSVFEVRDTAEEYYKNISSSSADKFKPLNNFLLKKADEPQDKVIELLAWLIDYPERPYQPGDVYEVSRNIPEVNPANEVAEDGLTTLDGALEEVGGTPVVEAPVRPAESKFLGMPLKYKSAVLAFAAAAAVALIAYLITPPAPAPQCMYWAGDRYKAITCEAKINNTIVLALDTFKLHHLKKITKPDTLSYYSIGKVWYTKKNNKPEFFTAYGEVPYDHNKVLKPLTRYMIDQHILKKVINWEYTQL